MTTTTPRDYAKTTEQIEIDILKQRMYEIETNVAALGDIMGKDNETALEKIAAIKENLKILQQMIYGEPLYFLPGLGVQVKDMNRALQQMQATEDARLNQMKGVKLTLIALGITGGGTLIGVLTQIFGGG